MNQKYRIVMINGAPEVGKSWLAKQLEAQIVGSTRVGLNDGLKEVMSKITGLNLFNDEEYAKFKETKFANGQTGREWMIAISEESKRFAPTVWVERFLDRVRKLSRTKKLVFCDSFGFPIEYGVLLQTEDVDTLNVYIGNNYIAEGDYAQFPGDSRFDLSRHCTIRSFNSTQALEATMKSLKSRNWI